jgi:hypothetical protein
MGATKIKVSLYFAVHMMLLCFSPTMTFAAKEDTARLVFEKRARSAQGGETFAYTVKRGENLLAIIRKELGQVQHRYREVLRHNPQSRTLISSTRARRSIYPCP